MSQNNNNINIYEELKRPNRKEFKDIVPLSTPFSVFIDPCGVCNFACTFCPNNHSDYEKEKRHQIMSYELYCKIIDDLTEFPEKIKVLNLYCFGEPLLNKDFSRMIKYANDKNVANEIFVVSNAYMLTKNVADAIVEAGGVDIFRVSLEAIGSEEYSRVTCRNIDFDKLVGNIRYLYEISRGTRLKIEIKIVDLALRNDEIKAQFFEIFEDISDYIRIDHVDNIWPGFDSVGSKETNQRFLNENICSRPFFQFVIHSNGMVSICCADWKQETVYGDAKKDNLRELWNSGELRKLQIQMASGGRSCIKTCAQCDFFSPDNICKEDGLIIANRYLDKVESD